MAWYWCPCLELPLVAKASVVSRDQPAIRLWVSVTVLEFSLHLSRQMSSLLTFLSYYNGPIKSRGRSPLLDYRVAAVWLSWCRKT